MNNTQDPPKKRAYSRNGCVPCKQRKAKCDEARPQCRNCKTTNRECSYRQILKFTDRRSFTLNGSSLSNIKNVNRPKRTNKSITSTLSDLNNKLPPSKDIDGETQNLAGRVRKKPKVGDDPFLENLPQVVQNNISSGALQLPPLKEEFTENDIANETKNEEAFSATNLPISASALAADQSMPAPTVPTPTPTPTPAQLPMPVPAPVTTHPAPSLTQLDIENSLFDGATTLITDLNELFGSLDMFNPANFNLPSFPKVSDTPPTSYLQHQHQPQSRQLSLNDDFRFDSLSPSQNSIDSPRSFTGLSQNIINDAIPFSSVRFDHSLSAVSNLDSNKEDMKEVKELNVKMKNVKVANEENENDEEEEKDEEKDEDEEEDDEEEEDDDDEYDDEDDEENSNQLYIQTLTKSLKDYGSPSPFPVVQSPASHDEDQKKAQSTFPGYIQNDANDEENPHLLNAFPPPHIDHVIPFDYIEMMNKTILDEDIESLASFFNWSLSSSHIRYMKIFVTNIHLNILPFSTNYTNNAYTRIFLQQAKNAPHLLFAILAISARFEVYQIEQHPNIPNHEDRLNYHKSFRSYYLSSCLKSLESVLHSKQTTLNNIETLLLTIQVLASDFSGHKGSQWRTHLHGAKDLLIKYCRYRPLSLELTIVWVWFYSMEVLAALTAPKGGTIHNFEEMYEFLPVLCPTKTPFFDTKQEVNIENSLLEQGKLTDALKILGIAIEGTLLDDQISNFNMYLGYDDTMVEVFNLLVFAIECIKCKNDSTYSAKFNQKNSKLARYYEMKILDRQGETLNSDFLLSLMSLIKKARTFKYINNSTPYIVPLGEKKHPSEILETLKAKLENKNGTNSSDLFDASQVLKDVRISAYIHPNQSSTEYSDVMSPGGSAHSPYKNTISSRSNSKSPAESPGIDSTLKSLTTTDHDTSADIGNFIMISDTQISTAKNDVYFSWVDLSQQLNADAAFLRLLTLKGGVSNNGMSIKSNLVQDITHRMIMGLYGLVRFRADIAEDIDDNNRLKELNDRYLIQDYIHDPEISEEDGFAQLKAVKDLSNWDSFEFDKYLDYQFDNRLVMIQWALYVCGLCCVEPKHKAIIECCFTGLVGLGVGSGELSMKKLRKVWTLQKMGRFDFDKFNLFGQGFDDDEEDDYVPFM